MKTVEELRSYYHKALRRLEQRRIGGLKDMPLSQKDYETYKRNLIVYCKKLKARLTQEGHRFS